jgi:hypothetical protein
MQVEIAQNHHRDITNAAVDALPGLHASSRTRCAVSVTGIGILTDRCRRGALAPAERFHPYTRPTTNYLVHTSTFELLELHADCGHDINDSYLQPRCDTLIPQSSSSEALSSRIRCVVDRLALALVSCLSWWSYRVASRSRLATIFALPGISKSVTEYRGWDAGPSKRNKSRSKDNRS